MKRVVVNASTSDDKRNQKSANKMLRDAYGHLKQALDLLAEMPNDGPYGEFSNYVYHELDILVRETGQELHMF